MASALPKCSIMSGCGIRIVLRVQKPLALCDRCPCFGSLFPPLAALTFAASSIICAFGLAAAAPRSPYRHLKLCGIAKSIPEGRSVRPRAGPQAAKAPAALLLSVGRPRTLSLTYGDWGIAYLYCGKVSPRRGRYKLDNLYQPFPCRKIAPKIIRPTRDRKTGIRYNRGNRKSTL